MAQIDDADFVPLDHDSIGNMVGVIGEDGVERRGRIDRVEADGKFIVLLDDGSEIRLRRMPTAH